MEIYDITEIFPEEEKYALTTQIRKSANSVIANIAEAHGRYYYADKIRVLYISRGELQETQSHLAVAYGRKYIDTQTFQNLSRSYEDLKVKINNYITSINNKKQNG
ncbi:four helix bundle protein [Candidatus Parcubacteria bacterium]|nr:four helix bundle protein [Candidatus Parcubacteria bacterium]